MMSVVKAFYALRSIALEEGDRFDGLRVVGEKGFGTRGLTPFTRKTSSRDVPMIYAWIGSPSISLELKSMHTLVGCLLDAEGQYRDDRIGLLMLGHSTWLRVLTVSIGWRDKMLPRGHPVAGLLAYCKINDASRRRKHELLTSALALTLTRYTYNTFHLYF